MPSGGMSAIKLSPRLGIATLLTTGAAVAATGDCIGTGGTGLEGAASVASGWAHPRQYLRPSGLSKPQ